MIPILKVSRSKLLPNKLLSLNTVKSAALSRIAEKNVSIDQQENSNSTNQVFLSFYWSFSLYFESVQIRSIIYTVNIKFMKIRPTVRKMFDLS